MLDADAISQVLLNVLTNAVFFFQAEDGIRDRDVTGVQTCALPISDPAVAAAAGMPGGPDEHVAAAAAPVHPRQDALGAAVAGRGEQQVPPPAAGARQRPRAGRRAGVG